MRQNRLKSLAVTPGQHVHKGDVLAVLDNPDTLLPHVSPLTWEHINLTGIYSWAAEPLKSGDLRPLRETTKPFFRAA